MRLSKDKTSLIYNHRRDFREVNLSVEFVIRPSDLRQATSQLKANRGEHSDSDFVDILVSECAATFRSVGTETEVPVEGKRPGSVRLPLRIVDAIKKVVPTFKKKELPFQCEPGIVRIGSWSVKHPDIELGRIPDQRLSLPIDLSVVDTLALAQILSPDKIVQEGMRSRVEEAVGVRSRVVADAHSSLQMLGIPERQVQDLVDAHVKDAAEKLRRSLEIA